ncbi:MAG TPA: hypothetical protein VLA28_05240 [Afifellaceae bacterium]|nr:hypothetical protein [Afifellaceae bacterium]
MRYNRINSAMPEKSAAEAVMNDIVERVARALCAEWGDDPNAPVDWGPFGCSQGAKWETFQSDAIVAIRAYNEALAAEGFFIAREVPVAADRRRQKTTELFDVDRSSLGQAN